MTIIEVLVPGAGVDKLTIAEIAGTRLHFSPVLSQGFLGLKETMAALIL